MNRTHCGKREWIKREKKKEREREKNYTKIQWLYAAVFIQMLKFTCTAKHAQLCIAQIYDNTFHITLGFFIVTILFSWIFDLFNIVCGATYTKPIVVVKSKSVFTSSIHLNWFHVQSLSFLFLSLFSLLFMNAFNCSLEKYSNKSFRLLNAPLQAIQIFQLLSIDSRVNKNRTRKDSSCGIACLVWTKPIWWCEANAVGLKNCCPCRASHFIRMFDVLRLHCNSGTVYDADINSDLEFIY